MNPRRSRGHVLAAGATLAVAAALTAGTTGTPSAATPATHHDHFPSPQPLVPAQVTHLAAADAAPPGPGYSATSRHFTPKQIQNSYNLSALYAEGLDGSGKTIAIVDSFGYPGAAGDLKQFSQDYGLPLMCGMPDVACEPGMATFKNLTFGNHQVKPMPPKSQSPGQEDSSAWSVEVALDMEYAHTIAPGANITLVATPTAETLGVQGFPQMMNAEQYLVDHHMADVVTQSFGVSEGSFSSTHALESLRHAFKSGADAGMTFLASSGDSGSVGLSKEPVGKGGTQLSTPQVGWPASDPLVTAVGGTTLCTDAPTGTTVDSANPPADCQDNPGQREVGWNGSGGGFSNVFTRPDYQSALPAGSAPIPAGQRGVPDISMNASCTSWVVVLDTAPGYDGYYGVCGTSEASPMFAGVVAIADQAAGHDLGLLNEKLYALGASSDYPSSVFDVTSGDNTQEGSGVPGFAAGTGWDAVTGLGTPADAQAFVHALAGS